MKEFIILESKHSEAILLSNDRSNQVKN